MKRVFIKKKVNKGWWAIADVSAGAYLLNGDSVWQIALGVWLVYSAARKLDRIRSERKNMRKGVILVLD